MGLSRDGAWENDVALTCRKVPRQRTYPSSGRGTVEDSSIQRQSPPLVWNARMTRRVVTRSMIGLFMIGLFALAILADAVVSRTNADAGGFGGKGCLAKNVKVTLGPTFGAAGTSIQVIVFRNAGPSTCSLAGNPAVGFIAVPGARPEYDAVPIVSPGNDTAPSGSPPRVLVRPGGAASVALLGGDVPIADNPAVTWAAFQVALPGQSHVTTFSQHIGSYSGFRVTEFTKGSSAGT